MRLASFFWLKNSRDEASAKGWMSFFLVKRMTLGRLRELRSVRRALIREEDDVPRRMRVVLGFSVAWGSRALRARAERAFLGFLLQEGLRFGSWGKELRYSKRVAEIITFGVAFWQCC